MSECSSLGQRLKHARVAAGLSLCALGTSLNVSHSTILRWENDQHNIPLSKAFELCSILRVPLAWLVFGPEGRSPQAGVSTPDRTPAMTAAPAPASGLCNYREVNYV